MSNTVNFGTSSRGLNSLSERKNRSRLYSQVHSLRSSEVWCDSSKTILKSSIHLWIRSTASADANRSSGVPILRLRSGRLFSINLKRWGTFCNFDIVKIEIDYRGEPIAQLTNILNYTFSLTMYFDRYMLVALSIEKAF